MSGMARIIDEREGLCTEFNDVLGLRCDRQEGHKPEGTHWENQPHGIMVWGPNVARYRTPETSKKKSRRSGSAAASTSSSGARRAPKK